MLNFLILYMKLFFGEISVSLGNFHNIYFREFFGLNILNYLEYLNFEICTLSTILCAISSFLTKFRFLKQVFIIFCAKFVIFGEILFFVSKTVHTVFILQFIFC